ncbi:MAG: hypothetical protein ACOX0E_00815 [Syntrophomonadaceae bacterium]
MESNSGLDIFIAASVKYPELNAVKYQADKERISLELALKSIIDHKSFESFIFKLKEAQNLYYQLTANKPELLNIGYEHNSGFTFICFERDVKTLTEGEIEIFAQIAKETFAELLLMDESVARAKDSEKSKIKKNLLRKINRNYNGSTNFFSYREEGRVFVFNN